MKLSRMLLTISSAALLCASMAFAGPVNKGTLHLTDKVSVDGHMLNPGTYRVEWTGNGPEVQVKLVQGKDTVAAFSAHVGQQKANAAEDAYSAGPGPNGSPSLTQIYLAKHDVVLTVDHNSSDSGNTNNQQSPAQGAN
ncbi:MAG: hypothetical protein WBR26_17070 [Candidatus Acidiferrum sp.]